MAQVVKGFIADQPVELNNAATEATLTAMLAIAKKDSTILAAMARKAGVDAEVIKKASKALEQQAAAGTQAGQGLGNLVPKANILGGFLMDMGQSVMKTAGNLIDFGDELLEGKARASDLFKAFKDLPLGLGLLATMFQKAMQYQERNLDVYRQISDTGAGLNGSLNSLRIQASGMYLTLDEFADVMKTNSDVFRQLAGNAGSGAKTFQGISQALMKSQLGDELLALGFNFTQANNLIGSYIRTSGDGVRAGKNVAEEHARLAKASAQYGKDLDFLARLTGESREAAQKKLEEAQMETSWQMFVNSITDPVRKQNIQQALIRAQATGDKGVVDLFKARMMNFAGGFSDEAATVQSMFRGASEMVEGFVRIGNSNMSREKAQAELDRLQARGTAMTIKELESYKNIVMATGQGAEGTNKQLMAMQDLANKYNQAGKKNEAQILQSIIDARSKGDADAKAAAAAAQSEKRMKELSHQVNMALLPVLELLVAAGNRLVKAFSEFVGDSGILKKLSSAITAVANFIDLAFRDPDAAWNKISSWFKELLGKFFDAFSKSALGRAMFGNLAEGLQRDAKIDAMRALDLKRLEELEKKTELNQEEKDELQKMKKTIDEGRVALGQKFRESADEVVDRSKARNEAMDEIAKKYGVTRREVDVGYSERLGGNVNLTREYTDLMNKKIDEQKALEKRMKDTASGLEANRFREWKLQQMDPAKANSFAGGTASTGSLIRDFGKGTIAELHGKEAVLTEDQLKNLVKNLENSKGLMHVSTDPELQKQLTSAVIALNKQQERTNVLLGSIADYTRRTSEMGSNKFARV